MHPVVELKQIEAEAQKLHKLKQRLLKSPQAAADVYGFSEVLAKPGVTQDDITSLVDNQNIQQVYKLSKTKEEALQNLTEDAIDFFLDRPPKSRPKPDHSDSKS